MDGTIKIITNDPRLVANILGGKYGPDNTLVNDRPVNKTCWKGYKANGTKLRNDPRDPDEERDDLHRARPRRRPAIVEADGLVRRARLELSEKAYADCALTLGRVQELLEREVAGYAR